MSQLWHNAQMTRHCENLCECKTIRVTLPETPPQLVNNPFYDESF